MTNNLTPEYQARLDKWRAACKQEAQDGKSTRQWDYGDDLKTFQDKDREMWEQECKYNPGTQTR